MLNFPLWKQIVIFAIVITSVWLATSNFVSDETRKSALLSDKTINLGLDLQGGSYLLLEVQSEPYFKEQIEQLEDHVRSTLRDRKDDGERIIYTGLRIENGQVLFRLSNPQADMEEVEERFSDLKRTMVLDFEDDGAATLYYRDTAKTQMMKDLVAQSIEIVRRRVDETGTREPLIQRQGDDRILLQVPGLQNPDQLKEILGRTAKMTFHMLDENTPYVSANQRPAVGTFVLPDNRDSGRHYMVKRRAKLTGDMLIDARPSYNQYGQPVVTFRFNTQGAKSFAKITKENVGRPFAIVLDGKVVTAPNINEPILGGSGEISGGFSVEEANNLSILLRSGALPAPLVVMEERTVGPSLGHDSIEAGQKAAIIAMVLVLVGMVIFYGLFGLFANVALVINMVMIVAALSLFEATLTLPGIAGMVLTLGMAVDANILIFERIREEMRNGRTTFSALESGFGQAFKTIFDSNITTLIATLLLFIYGSGPVKGFAVTLSVGILCSMFSAILLTRLMIVLWLRKFRPAQLPL